MASNSFHLFPNLPKELRDIIWAFAIRPERPSAKFFTVFSSRNDDEWSALAQDALSQGIAHHFGVGLRSDFAAPRCGSDPKKPSWIGGNLSAYLIDGGLWTACKESRETARRHYRDLYWRIKQQTQFTLSWNDEENSLDHEVILDKKNILDKENIFDLEDILDAPNSGTFMSGTERWRCATYPNFDLFCLQPWNPDTIEWEDVEPGIPLFTTSSGRYVKHIALDYDPEWWKEGYPASYKGGSLKCAIEAATDFAGWAENLWFIDYRIRRRLHDGSKAEDSTKGSRHQFYGNGCRFTEVQDHDSEWEMDGDDSVSNFLYIIQNDIAELNHICSGDGYPLHGPGDFSRCPNLGVLAYEVGEF